MDPFTDFGNEVGVLGPHPVEHDGKACRHRPILGRPLRRQQHLHEAIGREEILHACTNDGGHPFRAMAPFADRCVEGRHAAARDQGRGGRRDDRFVIERRLEGSSSRPIGLHDHRVDEVEVAGTGIDRDTGGAVFVGVAPHDDRALLGCSGDLGIGRIDQDRKATGAVAAHLGGRRDDRRAGTGRSEGEEARRLATTADKRHEFPVGQPEGLR